MALGYVQILRRDLVATGRTVTHQQSEHSGRGVESRH